MKLMHTFLSILFIVGGTTADTADYASFMSSLSYNWQNEFSDLRYQVEQLQHTDPQQYQQLAAQLGLKPGTQIDVPSQFDATWASKFVAAAQLYTPPAATVETMLETGGASTINSGLLITAQVTASVGASDLEGDSASVNESESDGGDSSHGAHKHSSGTSDEGATDGLDSEPTFTQNGNPVVGQLNTANTPIVPSGHGYSAAPSIEPSAALALGYMLLLGAMLL
ncbi:hypothetical protein BX070DRAFT_228472 [Coemansia spiralis]|nr:hypothetical protein BX070DRAFT_228472 [Coemansia spiralis]